MRTRIGILAAILLLTASVAWTPALADKRVALVIGNGAYENTPALANPANDAADVAAALKRLGFDVILETDLKKRAMEQALVRFARMAQDADAALFYYAGHGIQFRGANYLVPVDAKLEDEFSINFELTRVDDVTAALEQARGVKILILDACRNNPLAAQLSRVSTNRAVTTTRGLARIEAIRGMVIAYATQPDQVAVDGSGRNSPFTSALLKEMRKPGVEIGAMFRRVAADVNQATRGRQLPEVSISLFGDFYLNARESDVQAWAKIRDSGDADKLKAFLHDYADSPLAADARTRLAAIDRQGVEREQRDRLAQELAAREKAQRQQEQALKEFAERERRDREELLRQIGERQQQERQRLTRELEQRDKTREAQEQKLREQVEQARLERERLERLLLERDRAEKEKLAQENAERLARNQPRQLVSVPAASPAGASVAEAAKPNPADAGAGLPSVAGQKKSMETASLTPPQRPQTAPVTPTDIARDLQRELQRVGCYSGAFDGDWGARSKTALAAFLKRVHLASLGTGPSETALKAVKAQVGRVCPQQCSRGETRVGDRCIAKMHKPAHVAKRSPAAEPQGQPKGTAGAEAYIRSLQHRCIDSVVSACQALCDTGHHGACRRLRHLTGGGGHGGHGRHRMFYGG